MRRFFSILKILSLYCLFAFNVKAIDRSFENVCSLRPTIRGSESVHDADRSGYFIGKSDPRNPRIFSIRSDRSSSQYTSHIKSAVLFATGRNNMLVGNWDTLNGPFKEVFCFDNATAVSGSSVIVIESDIYPYNNFEASWIPPSQNYDPVFINGYVYDSNRRLHKMSPVKVEQDQHWNDGNFPSLFECGETKGCYLVPPNCPVGSCNCALTWQTHQDEVTFELMAPTDGWVGVGFSENRNPDHAEYVLCIRNAIDDKVSIKVARVRGADVSIHSIYGDLSYNNKKHRTDYRNGKLSCTFTKSKFVDQRLKTQYGWLTVLNKPRYIIATYGNQLDIQPDGVPLLTGPNNRRPIVSSARVNFNKESYPKRGYPSGSWLAKIHMCLMIIAWVLLASIAILTARYYRPIWNVRSVNYGKKSWLTVHQPLMITVAVLTVIAFIFMLFEVNWGWPQYGRQFWHAFLGVIVVVLAILNAALVLCVPRQSGRGYCIWFWIHWFVSSLAHCLAIPVIFLGMDLPRLDLWDWCSYLLLAWCIFHIITDLILEIHYCMTYRQNYERFEENGMNKKFDNRDRSGQPWKPFCLGLYILVTIAVTFTLVIAIIVYD